jgi:PAS domain S-box-containing protein
MRNGSVRRIDRKNSMMREAMPPDRSSRPQPQPKDILTVLSHDSRDGVWTVGADGSLLFINPVAERLLGWKTDNLQDKHFHDVVHGAHGDACPLQDVLRFGRRVTVEADRFARRDGATLAVSYTASPVLTDGQVMGAVITFWDQTVSEGVEEQLREREAQYRSIFEATTDGMVIADMDGLIVEAKPAFCRMHGYTYDELLGQPFITLVHPDSQHLFSESVQTIQAQGHWQGRDVNVRNDGTPLHLDASGTAFVHRGAPHLLGVGRDITERVQAEAQLREKEAQYRGIFEATIDGLVIIDLSGVIVEANPAYCAMFGYSYDELIGLPYTVLLPPISTTPSRKALPWCLPGIPSRAGRYACARSAPPSMPRAMLPASPTGAGRMCWRYSGTLPNACRRTSCWSSAWRSAHASSPRSWRCRTTWLPPWSWHRSSA